MRDNYKNAKIGWAHLNIFPSRTAKPEKLIFTTNHGPLVLGGATMGKTIFTSVYIDKKNLLKYSSPEPAG
jgi:hypothetical protein